MRREGCDRAAMKSHAMQPAEVQALLQCAGLLDRRISSSVTVVSSSLQWRFVDRNRVFSFREVKTEYNLAMAQPK